MGKSLTISVALATYNGEAFIRDQLESIIGQSRLPSEIVVSDDRSGDDTVALVREVLSTSWLKKHGVTLKVLENKATLGPGKNFEQAIRACSSDVVALCDQDDIWHPEKLETLVAVLERDPDALLVHSDARLVDATGADLPMTLFEGIEVSAWERDALLSGWSLPAISRRNLVTGATAIVRRKLAETAFDGPTIELHDGRLALVASVLDGLRFVPRELIGYRQHGGNHIGGTPMGPLDRVVAVSKSWRDLTRRLEGQNEELHHLLEALGDRVSARNKELLEARIAHNSWRIGLPTSRLVRIWPVLWGAVSGRYARYGRVPHDVLRDALMPPFEVLLGLVRLVGRKGA